MKHVAIYVRVSMKIQQTKSQEPDLKRWAANQDLPVVWYYDHGYTGTNMDRPGWQKLEAAMRAGKVSSVAVWRLDRLGRTAKGLSALFEEVQERGVGLVSMTEGIDLATPAGRLMAHVIASVAQYETEVRAERILAGQAVAKANGKTWGGSKAGVPKKLKPDVVAVIVAMRATGVSISRISEVVSLSRPTVRGVVQKLEKELATV